MRLLRAALAPVALTLALAAPAPAPAQVRLDAAQLRSVAVARMAAGDLAQAEVMARALLARDPDDATALSIAAEAATARRDWPLARRMAARAHGQVEGPARFRMARLAAYALAQEGRYTRAQIWLRRAAPDAPDARAERGLARDYRLVAARNPLTLRFGLGIAPSSNINGGSRAETLILPGLPFEFELSGDARALSGVTTTASLDLSHALPPLPTGPLVFDLRAKGRAHRLSDRARRQAPEARGADYAQAALSLGLRHRLQGDGLPALDLSAELGRDWYGGAPYSDRLGLGLSRPMPLGAGRRLSFGVTLDRVARRDIDASWWAPALHAALRQDLGADRLTLSAHLRETRSDRPDTGHDARVARLDYDIGQPVGPVALGFGIEAQWRDYDRSRYVRGGREDRSLGIEARLGLPEVGRYGFYPEIGLTGRRVWSNADLFDAQTLTLDIGLRSSF